MTNTSPQATVPEWTLIDRMNKALKVAGLDAKTIAVELGVHRNTIGNYLSGRSETPRGTLMAWAFRCGVPFDWLLNGTSDVPGVNTRCSLAAVA